MAVQGVNPDAEFAYVLKEDRGSEKPTVFYLRPMDARSYYRAQDNVVEVKGFGQRGRGETVSRILAGRQEQELLVNGIVRWDNFLVDGAAVDWPANGNDGQKLKALSHLLPRWRRELAQAISQEADVAEEEAGN